MSDAVKLRLQLDKPCCDCGKILPKDSLAVVATSSVGIGPFLVGHLIAWCDSCWKTFGGKVGESIQVIDI